MTRMLVQPNKLACNFCGKFDEDVEVLVSNKSAFICNECIIKCVGIVAERQLANLGKMTLTEVEGLDKRLFTEEQMRTVANRLAKLRNPFG